LFVAIIKLGVSFRYNYFLFTNMFSFLIQIESRPVKHKQYS